MQDFDYFQTLQNTIDNGGAEQFLDYLLTFDLADWHPRQIMKTPELNVQRQANLEVTHQYLYFVAETETIEVDRLKRYDLPEQGDLFIPTTELYKAIGEYAKSRNKRLPPDNIVGMHLTKILGPSKRAKRTANVNRRPKPVRVVRAVRVMRAVEDMSVNRVTVRVVRPPGWNPDRANASFY
jgi:hypothetical protein